ncbi:PAP2 domain containing protein, partial [Asbolus verrucosus]
IILTEFLRRAKNEEGLTFWRFKIPLWCYKAYQMLLAFGFGLLCAMVTVTLSKSITGRLRPHFLTVCAPDINCSLAENQHIYHINFNCTKNLDKPGILKNARLSFPSGHANFFMYCAVFFSIYLQKKMVWDGPKLFKSTIQFLSILSAFCIGLSRISNNFHHWTDVTAGFAIGGAYAVCANLKVLRTEASIDAASTNL